MLPYFTFLSQFWRKEKTKIALIVVFVMLSQTASLAEPFFFTRILDGFLRQIDNRIRFPTESVFFWQITQIVLLWIGVAFAARVFKNLQLYFVETVADRIGINIFESAFRHVLSLPLAFHVQQKSGEVFRKLSKARDDLTALFSIFFDKIFQNIFAIVLVILYVFWRAWQLGLVLVGFVPVFFLVTWLLTKKIKRTQAAINRANERLSGSALEAINNIEVVKSFAAEHHEQQRVAHDNVISHGNLQTKTIAFQQLTFSQGTIVNLARVALLWLGSLLAFRGVVSFGDVVLFTFYSFFIYQPLYEVGLIYSKYHEGISAVERLQTILLEPQTIQSPVNGRRPDRLGGEVEFRNVSFAYHDGGRKILSNISFLVSPGKKLAIVGLSGGGKSSIIKLLLRYYDPGSGDIFIDGKPLADYDLTSLRRRIGLVSQETVLFNGTLADNIRYGSFEAPDEAVARAAEQAYLGELVAKLPEGYQALVGERGLKLSGGEKQRVAIARAIIKRPDILVFDEATSSLDSHSEEQIKRAIHEVSQGVTAITVAHRFATVIDADEIILLKAGQIVERGTHEKLLASHGEYAKLYNLQTQRQHTIEQDS